MKKPKYINRIFLRITLIGYAGLLILLLVMDFMMIQNSREEREREMLSALEQSGERIGNEIRSMNNYLYGVYEENENFRALAEGASGSEEYEYAYRLNNSLRIYQATGEWMDGYYLAYGGEKEPQWLYHNNRSDEFPEINNEIKELAMNYIRSGRVTEYASFRYEGASGEIYWVTLYKRQKAILIGINYLDKYIRHLEGSDLGFIDLMFYTADSYESGEKEALHRWEKELGQISGTELCLQKESEYLIGSRIDSREIWILATADASWAQNLSAAEAILLLITLASIVAVIIFYRQMVRILIRPMYRLVDVMEQIRNGSSRQIPDLQMPYYELNLVNVILRNMVDELRSEKLKHYEETISRKEAELQFLQLQLNPHFYLNCLKTLNAMAADRGLQDMQELILQISVYLRYLLSVGRRTVTLREELEFTGNYIALQRLLSDRKIEIETEIEEGIGECEVPILCVQTFVENSVKYASKDLLNQTLRLRIEIHRLQMEGGEALDITVSDNGQGYPEERLADLNARDRYSAENVGINNLKKRCNLLYGEAAEYSFYNMEGAVSELILPVKQGGVDENLIGG
ncbi:MAG: histidine kinase [Eubacteriales bacterium]|nr:histidine kinase [Eubacteriales bacterium]